MKSIRSKAYSRQTRSIITTVLGVAGAVLVACHDRASQGEAPPGAVARYGDEFVTGEDLDAWILALPVSERPQVGDDLDAWFEDQVTELVVDRVLRRDVASSALATQPELRDARDEAERQLVVHRCLSELDPQLERVTEADLEAEYRRRSDRFDLPERRYVYHLFVRSDPSGVDADARLQASELRDRALAGESFQQLASAHSDSESRHRQGAIEWVTPGQLPGGFDRVIFSLDEGVPSEPVMTRDGAHLFLVDQVLPPRRLELDEVRPRLRELILSERRQRAMAEIEARATVPEGALVLDEEEFRSRCNAGDPDQPVLRIGELELNLGDLRGRVSRSSQLQAATAPTPPTTIRQAWQVLESIRRQAVVAGYCLSEEVVDREHLEPMLDQWTTAAAISVARNRRMLNAARRDTERLRQYYESNLGQFSSPPRWHVRRLYVPLDADARAVMVRLEAAAQQVTPLEQLRRELGGEIEDLGLRTAEQLRAINPKLPFLVAPLEPGALTAPYRTATTLEIGEVVERLEGEPLPFDEALDQVAAAYVRQYTREVYEQVEREIVSSVDLELLPDQLAAAREAGIPQGDVTVDELEAMLEQLTR